ncbi:MAG TPA: VCBS repeat-containing protein [Planctomycetota bacterium]|nr:VCBS repeat-containing protein [Planctomycetota bacterium]
MGFRTIQSAAFLAFLTGTAAAQGTLFPVDYWYPALGGTYGSTLVDLNADGKLDFVVANYYTDKVSVYLGTGTGMFNPQPAVPVGATPRSLVVADMNGDTKPDLVTVNSSTDNVSVLLGDGLGGFGAATLFATPSTSFPVWIDAGDLDGDGKLDIVTGNQHTNDLSVLLGNGAGGLGSPSNFNIGFSAERIRLADMDANGTLDCVTACYLDDRVTVHLGDGNGHFNLVDSEYANEPKGLAVGDVNADGKLDVVVPGLGNGLVYRFLGQGNGGLEAAKSYHIGTGNPSPASVMIADVSGDGRPDLITCNLGTPTSLSVLVGVGGGEFAFTLTSPIPESAYDAVAADLNGDGFADVVTSNMQSSSMRIHMCAGVGAWEHYCTAKTNSQGCVPTIRAIGTPSVSNPRPYWVYVSNVLNSKPGLFIYKLNGVHASTPFQGGTLCIGPSGIRRTPGQNSGNDPKLPTPNCSGGYALNFNAFAQGLAGGNPDPALLVLGNTYQLQAWSRDPGFAAPNSSGLTSALDVTPWL